jgi:hypothetical protein
MRHRHTKNPHATFKRHRGGQPGNANAYKHGFYSARLLSADLQAAEKHRSEDLQADIDMVTISIDNFLRSASDGKQRSWEQYLVQLRAVTLAAATKGSLLRIQSNMEKKLADVTETGSWLSSLLSEEAEGGGSSSPSDVETSTPSWDHSLPPPDPKPKE